MESDRTRVEEYELPCAEALLAGTLALMTAHAQACCGQRRALMASKIAANLSLLAQDEAVSAPFRATAAKLRSQWESLGPGPGESFWHEMPKSLQ